MTGTKSMPVYANAALMLLAVIAAFFALAKLAQRLRSGQLTPRWPSRTTLPDASPMRVERSCMIDGTRRMVAVLCEGQRVVLLTGGPTDLVVSVTPVITGVSA